MSTNGIETDLLLSSESYRWIRKALKGLIMAKSKICPSELILHIIEKSFCSTTENLQQQTLSDGDSFK